MSATNAFETSLLTLIFNNTNIANIGDATGLRGSSTAGVFYTSLATGDPGETGTQSTSETTYTNYLRSASSAARSSAGWTISGNNASNAAAITYAQCGATGATISHFVIGTDSTGTGTALFKGALDSSLAVSNGITPSFAIGALDCNCD